MRPPARLGRAREKERALAALATVVGGRVSCLRAAPGRLRAVRPAPMGAPPQRTHTVRCLASGVEGLVTGACVAGRMPPVVRAACVAAPPFVVGSVGRVRGGGSGPALPTRRGGPGPPPRAPRGASEKTRAVARSFHLPPCSAPPVASLRAPSASRVSTAARARHLHPRKAAPAGVPAPTPRLSPRARGAVVGPLGWQQGARRRPLLVGLPAGMYPS